jgi:hypothetical protein
LPHYDTYPDCGGPTTIAWEGGEVLSSCEICRGEGVPPELTTADTTASRVDPKPTKLSLPNVYAAETSQERPRPRTPACLVVPTSCGLLPQLERAALPSVSRSRAHRGRSRRSARRPTRQLGKRSRTQRSERPSRARRCATAGRLCQESHPSLAGDSRLSGLSRC